MIAAAAQSKMLFDWFDVAVILILGFGFWRGRKHGMTKEFVPLLRWLAIVVAGGLGYQFLGDRFIHWGVIKGVFGNSVTEKTAAYISGYLVISGLVMVIFVYIRRGLMSKLEGSSIFGGSEYYLGMVSGVIRYACMSVFGLALLHSPHYSAADIAAQKAYNNRWYGGGDKDFKGDLIPSLEETQQAVFQDSFFGPFIEKGIGILLIDSTPAAAAAKKPVMDIQQ